MFRLGALMICAAGLAACTQPEPIMLGESPTLSATTPTSTQLKELPPPVRPVPVAVYQFDDETGQHKPNDSFSDYSKAVTQGGASLLVEALLNAGDGRWFEVLERTRLGNLLQERKIVDTMRAGFARDDGSELPALAPMKYAGILLEGGVIGYDSDIVTGGAGARYLGIGGNSKYRRDVVTVTLRATSVKSGQVLESVSASKTIFSVGVQGSIFKFVSLDNLLEAEAGFTMNEPVLLATRQAVEKAVLSLIAEGAQSGLWAFANGAGNAFMRSYVGERDGGPVEASNFASRPQVSTKREAEPSRRPNLQTPTHATVKSALPKAAHASTQTDQAAPDFVHLVHQVSFPKVPIRLQPNAQSPIAGELTATGRVKILAWGLPWSHVETANGLTGFVNTRWLRENRADKLETASVSHSVAVR